MIAIDVNQLVQLVDGQVCGHLDDHFIIENVTTDSRKVLPLSLFVALVGDQFDGHNFVSQAAQLGAGIALVQYPVDATIPQIIVKDCRIALGQISSWVREHSDAKIVALTGSSGKTSVKEMTASILKCCGNTLFTQGNFNNDIGVPLTLLRLSKQDEFAVVELGANHIGEIAYTTKLTQPQSALINNIAEAHIEGFGSLAGVAKAKGEIFQGLPESGSAIINMDSYSKKWLDALVHKNIIRFSLENIESDFYAKHIDITQLDSGLPSTTFLLHTPQGEGNIHLPLLGRHNVSNAVAAAALAMSVGAQLSDVQKGLSTITAVKGRLYPIMLAKNQLILDDTYNANMGSMAAAIDVLSYREGYKVLVVGDMAELGAESVQYHQKIGELAKKAKLDCVVSVGILSKWISEYSQVGHHFDSKEAAITYLKSLIEQYATLTILVKGSRSARMEQVINALTMQ